MNNTTSHVRSRELPETINIHLTRTCNFGCRYCYADFGECGSARIQPDHLRRIIEAIGRADSPLGGRSRKVNFAGGEPLLYTELPDILALSKQLGLATSLVTNGSLLNERTIARLSGMLDICAVSVDSGIVKTNDSIGRCGKGSRPDAVFYRVLAQRIRDAGIRFKVNTVVNRLNLSENLGELVASLLPFRWKLFQVKEVIGQNDITFVELAISGTSLKASEEALDLARSYPNQLYATAGVHPHDGRNATEQTIPELRKLAAQDEVVAIGECGLDFNRDFSPRPDQEKWFEAQVALAEELQMPLFLHERDAHERFCDILKRARKSVPAVIHCFTGTKAELNAYLELGLHIGITGWICDERRGMHLRELVKQIPLDRLMIETDAPFLLPRSMPNRPKDGRNEPAFLPHVLQTLADCVEKPVGVIAQETSRTATQFFRLGVLEHRKQL